MNAAEVIRAAAARREAVRRYAAVYDRFAELEQLHRGRHEVYEAQGAHVHALRVLRAWLAEQDDPTPEGLR